MANLHLNGQFMENLKINLEAKDFTKFSSNFNLLKLEIYWIIKKLLEHTQIPFFMCLSSFA